MKIFRNNQSRFRSSLGSRKNSRRGAYPLTRTFSIAALAIILLLFIFARTFAAGLLWDIVSPLSEVMNGMRAGGEYLTLPFTSEVNLLSENTLLKAELAQAQADAANQNILAEQNTQLKSQLGCTDTTPSKVLAYIIARPPELPYDTLILDVGVSDGVASQDIVGAGTTAIGYISTVATHNSRVTLFSAPTVTTAAVLRGTLPVMVNGMGGGALTAEVPQNTDVSVGDPVSLPGSQPLVIAYVASVDAESGASYKSLNLSLAADLFELPTVDVWSETLPTGEVTLATSTSKTK